MRCNRIAYVNSEYMHAMLLYFFFRLVGNHDIMMTNGVARAALVTTGVYDRSQFLHSGMVPIVAVPSLLLSTDAILSKILSGSSIKHPFVYSDEWSGTNLPLLDLSNAVAKAEWMKTSNDGKQQKYRWPMGRWPDPILRRTADPVDTSLFGTNTLRKACNILRNTAVAEGAVGLAAQQCGVNASIVYLRSDRRNSFKILINPKILDRSPEIDMMLWRESCLVLPSTFQATLLRDAWVEVSYYDLTDMERKRKSKTFISRHVVRLYGEIARVVQHEMDHDRGILVADHVSLNELESNLMRSIEQPGHEQRMQIAYSRNLYRYSE